MFNNRASLNLIPCFHWKTCWYLSPNVSTFIPSHVCISASDYCNFRSKLLASPNYFPWVTGIDTWHWHLSFTSAWAALHDFQMTPGSFYSDLKFSKVLLHFCSSVLQTIGKHEGIGGSLSISGKAGVTWFGGTVWKLKILAGCWFHFVSFRFDI